MMPSRHFVTLPGALRTETIGRRLKNFTALSATVLLCQMGGSTQGLTPSLVVGGAITLLVLAFPASCSTICVLIRIFALWLWELSRLFAAHLTTQHVNSEYSRMVFLRCLRTWNIA